MIAEIGQFTAQLDTYSGPLDLLLYLIKEQEVEITDLPIITITEQYLAMVAHVEKFDPNQASEFLVLAATLIEIKSKMLLPREEVDFSEIEDPRSDLIEQLLAYQEFKNKARQFNSLFETRKLKYPRGRSFDTEDDDGAQVELGEINSWDLLTMMEKIVSETLKETPTVIAYEDVPISVHMDQIIKNLDLNKSNSFRELVKLHAKDRIHLVGLFIAILELCRRKYIRIEQNRDFSDIHLLSIEGKNYTDVTFSDDEIVTPEDASATEDTDNSIEKDNKETSEEETVSFSLEKENEDNHSLEIDGFYKTNYRLDKNEDGIETLPQNVENEFLPEEEEVAPSMDVEQELLDIIRHKIPVPIFDPKEEDLILWREQNPDVSAEDFTIEEESASEKTVKISSEEIHDENNQETT